MAMKDQNTLRLALDQLYAQNCVLSAIDEISQQNFAPKERNPYDRYFQAQPTPPDSFQGSVEPCSSTPSRENSPRPQDELPTAIAQKGGDDGSTKAEFKLPRQKIGREGKRKPPSPTPPRTNSSCPQDELQAAIARKRGGRGSTRRSTKAETRQRIGRKARGKPRIPASHKMLTRSRVTPSHLFKMLNVHGDPVLVDFR